MKIQFSFSTIQSGKKGEKTLIGLNLNPVDSKV